MNNFSAFDPLKAKSTADTEVAALAQKREIKNILGSYVGWYDPFAELIQNSLDAIEERAKTSIKNYVPTVWIEIDIENNSLRVTDNGIGLNEQTFSQFLCPDISFKSGKTRGHKGVGATYLAYGFNYIQVATKTPGFTAVGKMEKARDWLDDENPAGNPQVKPDTKVKKIEFFDKIDQGVSIKIQFDKNTHPRDLKWIIADKAEQWYKILQAKTGLGAFYKNPTINVNVFVLDKKGKKSTYSKKAIEYYLPYTIVQKAASIKDIIKKENELFKKKGKNYTLPSSLTNLDCFYQYWTFEELDELIKQKTIKLDIEKQEYFKKYQPDVYVSYVYSLKIWDAINKELNVRSGLKILFGGIQLAANNMPQGELIQIPLNRNIGRQNQIHVLMHFRNCSADLGRKGFQSEVVELAKEISKELADGPLMKVTHTLKTNTGTAPNLMREKVVDDWKNEMIEYEKENPLELISENFFLPTKKISITSNPSREQDVIALFNQLIAGGVIRGMRIMSTNERLVYDGLYRVVIDPPKENHIYHQKHNPLGVAKSIIDDFKLPFITAPKIMEYKFSLDALIEDIENGWKNSNEIGLIIVWETGDSYKANYKITSLIDENNLALREYHGVTHIITNINTGQKEMDLIVLSELINLLNDAKRTMKAQIKKYED
jgi:hypothetical protein